MTNYLVIKDYLKEFLVGLRSANRVAVSNVMKRAAVGGLSNEQVLHHLLIPGLEALGKGWEKGAVSLTQVYMGGRIAEDLAVDLLPPAKRNSSSWCKVVIGTLQDSHGLGQRIVAAYLAASGARVISLGLGVAPETFVQRTREESADIIAISVLMYSSALQVSKVRELVDKEKLRAPIIVGGAPFNMDRTLWKQVGASAMGNNPAEGIAVIGRLTGLKP